jgi:hypothetical protein
MTPCEAAALTLTLCSAGVACGDPVRERRVEALGTERVGVAVGPLHRPGQPCLACHDGEDSVIPRFSVAGTVFLEKQRTAAAAHVTVELIDARDRKHEAETNCAGNFYVDARAFEPQYPLWTSLRAADYRIDMHSPIGRDGSCASCHTEDATQRTTEAVYLYSVADTTIADDEGDCP